MAPDEKEVRESAKPKIKIFLMIGVPVGCLLAVMLNYAENLDIVTFLCIWAVLSLFIGFGISAIISRK